MGRHLSVFQDDGQHDRQEDKLLTLLSPPHAGGGATTLHPSCTPNARASGPHRSVLGGPVPIPLPLGQGHARQLCGGQGLLVLEVARLFLGKGPASRLAVCGLLGQLGLYLVQMLQTMLVAGLDVCQGDPGQVSKGA
eukprot:1161499-Pelagomonas_calceolata.AAC.7